MKHICSQSRVCTCYILGLEPDEQCPQHGYPWPPRCDQCGRFIKHTPIEEVQYTHDS